MFSTSIDMALSGFEFRQKGGLLFLLGLPFLPIDFSALSSIILGFAVSLSILAYFRRDAIYRIVQNCFFQLALPDNDDVPTLGPQLTPHLLVSLLVAGYLRYPEIHIGLGDGIVFTPFMAVPETTVDEDDCTVLWENDIGGTRQAFIIHPIAESQMPECVTKFQFRFCGSGMDGSHITMALIGRENVWHW